MRLPELLFVFLRADAHRLLGGHTAHLVKILCGSANTVLSTCLLVYFFLLVLLPTFGGVERYGSENAVTFPESFVAHIVI